MTPTSMRNNFREQTNALLVYIARSHNFCAAGVSSGHATTVTLLLVLLLHGSDVLLISIFYRSTWLLFGYVLNVTTRIKTLIHGQL